MDNINELISLPLANLVLPLAKDLVLPKVQKVLANKKSNFNPNETSIILQNYIKDKYIDYSIIDTIAFSNMQTLFDVLYEPLTIVGNSINEEKISYRIDEFPEMLFEDYYRIIIEDTGGMGKSTLLKKIFKTTIENKRFIPILIYLSKINKNNSIYEEIYNQINNEKDVDINKDIKKLLKDGDFIIMFDGFDEISISNKEFVINNLHEFVNNYKNNYYIISTRPEDSIMSFGDFKKFNVKPLDIEEAFDIIKRYDYYSFKKISELLISKIKEDTNQDLSEYLKNPFLVSLLYKSFDYAKDIPLKKTHFYSQVYNALFEQHDLSKETYLKRDKHSKLHLDDFERVLRCLGFMTLKSNSVEYQKDYFIKMLNDIKEFNPEMDFKPTDYYKDLIETVPLFRKDGDYIRWAHKSLQGYFASKFIWIDARERQESILRKIYDDKDNIRFFSILELFFELDQLTFESYVLFWFLNDFVSYVDKWINYWGSDIDDDIMTIIIATFGTKCHSTLSPIRINLSGLGQVKTPLKTVAIMSRIDDDGDKLHYKGMMVDYPEIDSTFMVTFTNVSNFLTILDFVVSKYSYLVNKERSFPKGMEKLLFMEKDKPYKITCERENKFTSNDLRNQTANLINNHGMLNYEKCVSKLKELNERKNRDSLFDW